MGGATVRLTGRGKMQIGMKDEVQEGGVMEWGLEWTGDCSFRE